MNLFLLMLMACKDGEKSQPSFSCDDPSLSYHTVGQPFLRDYCTSCHSAQLTGQLRFGAPGNVDLDSLKDARNWASRIRARSIESDTMPPTGGIKATDKANFEAWLDCGTPGTEINPLEVATHPQEVDAHNVLVEAIRDHTHPDRMVVTREVKTGGSDDGRIGFWSVETYRIASDEAWLVGYEIYETAVQVSRRVTFDPELPILLLEPEWNATVTATIETMDGTSVEIQDWYGTAEFLGTDDGHERDTNPLNVVVTRNGETWRWHISAWYAITSQWVDLPDGSGWSSLQYMGGNAMPSTVMFALDDNAMWGEKMIAWGSQ